MDASLRLLADTHLPSFIAFIADYPLARAMEDGFVKEPAVVTQRNFDAKAHTPEEIEKTKLEDGVRLHETTKVELLTYARENGLKTVKPFMLVIARDTTHAASLLNLIESENFYDGRYKGKVIQVDSRVDDGDLIHLGNLEFRVIDSRDSDQDPRVLEIYYPNVIPAGTAYILPRVQIEVSCRSLREPFTVRSFGALVDEDFAGKDFTEPLFEVPTVNAERTFLEKLFLLHEEFHRPTDKMRVDRLSRHLYDLYHLSKNGIADKAINDKELYETIVAHRYKYSKVGDVDYNLHNPKTLNPIPIESKMDEWKTDYTKMKEDMIYTA